MDFISKVVELISAFRVETRQDAITPDSLGSLLLRMINALRYAWSSSTHPFYQWYEGWTSYRETSYGLDGEGICAVSPAVLEEKTSVPRHRGQAHAWLRPHHARLASLLWWEEATDSAKVFGKNEAWGQRALVFPGMPKHELSELTMYYS